MNDQIIQLPTVEPGHREFPLPSEGVDGNQHSIRVLCLHTGCVHVICPDSRFHFDHSFSFLFFITLALRITIFSFRHKDFPS